MRPIRTPSSDFDRQVAIQRAHRLRSAAMAEIFRGFARWVSHAAR